MEEDGQSGALALDANRRACDACRTRKVHSDRESPCSHCISAKVVCIYTPVEPPKKRTRILLTPQYERKIDLIDNRLEKAIRLLESLQASESSDHSSRAPGKPQNTKQSPTSVSTPASDSTKTNWPRGQVVEGDTSLAAHPAFANDFLQKVVATNSLQGFSPELCDTLDELSSILTQGAGAGAELAYPHARPIQRPNLTGYEMPPLKKAIALIRMAKGASFHFRAHIDIHMIAQANAMVDALAKQLVGIGWIYEFLPFQRFTDMCLDVYLNDNHSEVNFITVNAGLYWLFSDYKFQAVPQEKDECIAHAHLCRDNLETVLSNLPLHLRATSDTVLALLFGAFYAIELSKPSLSWTLSAKASELCQTLGYHRLASLKNDKHEDFQYKQFLFWSIYFIDKSLSLRLGRPSTIPDWDITVTRPSTNDVHSEPALVYFVLSIETAQCQGKIYEMLYSPNSMTQPDHVKQSRVETLVSDLHELEAKTWETNTKWHELAKEQSGEDLITFFYLSEQALRLSLLTLVHRATPRLPGSATTFNHSCIAAARATLEKHEECIALMYKSANSYLATYMHW
ncbi:hypothetical protein BJY04DRAFT_220774 [Aspergillus karnatakaensis]|uniref:uncharacterized protein n=1 Tax=Aspergillus karnatakaensis TaxID=1810916 RepID=UPI003CCCC6AE